MWLNRTFDRPVILIVLGLLTFAAFRSIRPKYHLRTEMPPEFVDASTSPPPARVPKRAAEERIARAYWKCAVLQIQWSYGYAQRLPPDPPPSFMVNEADAGRGANDFVIRDRYWRRLQALWYSPGVWQKDHGWDIESWRAPLQSAGSWLTEQAQKFGRTP